MAANPTASVKNVKRKNAGKVHLRDKFSDREVLKILVAPNRTTAQGKRDYAMLCLLAFCALRTVELQRLDLDDLSTVDGQLVLHIQGKGSSESDDIAVISHPTAQAALLEWLDERGRKSGPMFWSLSRRSHGERLGMRSIRDLADYIRSAGIHDRRKTLHSLRHSAVSKVAKRDILAAKQLARHASLDTTMIYVHQESRLDNPPEALIDYVNGNGE